MPHELADLADVCRSGPLRHGFNLFWIGANSPAVHYVHEILKLGLTEVTLFRAEVGVAESAKHLGQVSQMFVEGGAYDNYIFQVCEHVFEFGSQDGISGTWRARNGA